MVEPVACSVEGCTIHGRHVHIEGWMQDRFGRWSVSPTSSEHYV